MLSQSLEKVKSPCRCTLYIMFVFDEVRGERLTGDFMASELCCPGIIGPSFRVLCASNFRGLALYLQSKR